MDEPLPVEEFAHAAEKLEFGAVLGVIAALARSERAKRVIHATRFLDSVEEAERSQRETVELIGLRDTGESIPLGGWRDSFDLIDSIRASGHRFSGEELSLIAGAESKAAEVSAFLGRHAEKLPLIAGGGVFRIQGDFVERVRRTIGDDFEVVDGGSDALRRLRRDAGALRGRLRRAFADFAGRVARSTGYEFVTIRGERYVVSIPRGEASRFRGIVHQTSASGASLYVEPLEFVDENNKLESLLQEERDEVARILLELSTEVLERKEALLGNQDALLALDLVSAKADFAQRFRCILPEHSDAGALVLRGARHPLLEKRFAEEGSGRPVRPLEMSCDEDLKALVISGPNAGGKTVALKTVGLLVLMDGAGLLVPCDHGTVIPRYDMVFVDIGDDQSIEMSLSTFSSRIVTLKRILERAGRRSLVLIDEIGDGTDPEEGAALAEAALERLMPSCGRVIVTTHLKSLKGWAHETPGARNATLEFDPDRLEPLFALKMGVPGRSWGIEMAGRLGLPAEIIARATEGLARDTLRLEELLAHLERTERAVAAERAELREKDRVLADLIAGYRERLDGITKDRDALIAAARQEALDIITEARRDMERLVREIKATGAGREAIREAHARVESEKAHLEKKLAARKKAPRAEPAELRTGAWAEIASLGKKGRILSIDASRVFLELDGGLRVETGANDLRAADAPKGARGERKASWTTGAGETISGEISVRGLEKAEALERVDAFLDRAVLQGLRTVVVIHGIGKGILKRAIYQTLRKDPRVADIRPGEPARGGDGVAIVDLK